MILEAVQIWHKITNEACADSLELAKAAVRYKLKMQLLRAIDSIIETRVRYEEIEGKVKGSIEI